MTYGDASGPPGTKLLHEDQRIRVWLLELEPGGASEWHTHKCGYMFIVTHPGQVRTERLDGAVEYQDDPMCHTELRSKSEPHRLVNDGPGTYQNIVIEFLEQR